MLKTKIFAAYLGVLLVTSGCVVRTRDIFHPGDAPTQVARAQVNDPYPLPDVGPPMVGVRPPGFEAPRAEILRVQPRRDEPILASVGGPAPIYPVPAYATPSSPAPDASAAPAWNQPQPNQSSGVIYSPPPTALPGASQ